MTRDAPNLTDERERSDAAAELPLWWIKRARPEIVAAEIALCAPPLQADEVRTLVRPSPDPNICLLSMAGPAGVNLLTAVAARITAAELLVARAEMVTWGSRSTELIRTTLIRPGSELDDTYWQRLAANIHWNTFDDTPLARFEARGPVTVDLSPAPHGSMLVVEAPHRIGLLWATCAFLSSSGCVISEVQTESSGHIRQSAYLVDGAVDAGALAAALAGEQPINTLLRPLRHAWRLGSRLAAAGAHVTR